jgi:hypothetical protein
VASSSAAIVVDEKKKGKGESGDPVGTEPLSISSLIEQVNLLMKVLGETKFNMNTDDIQTHEAIIGKASVDTTDQAELIADINNLINTINEHLKCRAFQAIDF